MSNLVDIHSHILPNIDDGSKSPSESVEMLKMLKVQGVTDVIATPHFKMTSKSVSVNDFLALRQEAYYNLLEEIRKQNIELPNIRLGAEVYITMDLLESGEIKRLCIEGTKNVLLEMPYGEWCGWMFRMINEECKKEGITPIIAHIDRYTDIISKRTYNELFAQPFELQINAEIIHNSAAMHMLSKWIKTDKIRYVGSDCHGVEYRPPEMDSFIRVVEKKHGKGFIEHLNNCARELIV